MKTYAAVYVFYNDQKEVIYVGISQNPYVREREHKKRSPWFPEVSKMTIKWWRTRCRALEEEKNLIRIHKPKYNTLHNKIGSK